MNTSVCAIVVTYNRLETLKRQPSRTILAQTLRAN